MAAVRFIGIFTIVVFLATVGTPLANVLGGALSLAADVRPADAIVVLGGGMNGTMLGDESLRRFVYGVTLYKQGLAPRLILAGPADSRAPDQPEAEVRKALAIELGVPSGSIVTLPNVLTTRDEAEQTASGFIGGGSILLVTSSLHMRRAAAVFEDAGFRVFSAPSDDWPHQAHGPEARLELLRGVLEQAGGLLYYKLFGYV